MMQQSSAPQSTRRTMRRSYVHWAAFWFHVVIVCTNATTVTDMSKRQVCQHVMASSYSSEPAGRPLVRDSPYSININQTKYVLGRPITVTISGTENFKGVILQARKYSQSQVIGSFRESSTEASLRRCDELNDTVTAWLRSPKNQLTFTWIAPDIDVDVVEFVATVFKDEHTFWTNITSHTFKEGFAPIDLSQCGISKGCFRYAPEGEDNCDESSCTYLVTYTKTGREATFELSSIGTWAAIGFSSDAMMGGDDVFMCKKEAIGASVARYYNEYAHRKPVRQNTDPLTDKQWEIASDGRLSCRFSRPLKVHEDMRSVDLSNDWYQLYAWGPPIRGGPSLARHRLDSPPVSGHKITLSHQRNVISAAGQLQLPLLSLTLQSILLLITYCIV